MGQIRNDVKSRPSHIESLEPRQLLAGVQLDPSFGLRVDPRPGYTADQVAVTADGSIFTSGESPRGWLLAKFKPNGKPDPAFGSGGVVVPELSVSGPARELLLQPDGKVLIGGTLKGGGQFAIQRYTAEGELDTSWGENGTFTGAFSGRSEAGLLRDMALQPDGKLILAGADGYSDRRVRVMRLGEGGTLDTSFGTDGLVALQPAEFGSTVDVIANDVEIDAGGRAVVLVWINRDEPDSDIFGGVVRLLPDGSPDASFGGGDGAALVKPSDAEVSSLALASDGKIVVAGRHHLACAVWRLNADGSSDATFGVNGEGMVPERNLAASDVLVLPDGSVLVSAIATVDLGFYERQQRFAVTRFLADGRLDAQFGRGGVLEPPIKGNSHALGLASDPAASRVVAAGVVFPETGGLKIAMGKLIVAGSTPPGPGPSPGGPFSASLEASLKTTLPAALVVGGPVRATVSVDVLNNGPATVTGGMTAQLYASADSVLDGADVALGSVTTTLKLSPGKRKSLRLRLPQTLGVAEGTYQLLARLEYTDGGVATVLAPSSVQVADPFSETRYGPPTAPADVRVKPGSRLRVTVKAVNEGNVRSEGGDPPVVLYAAPTPPGSSPPRKWGVGEFDRKLKAGESFTLKIVAFVPTDTPPGEYRLFVSELSTGDGQGSIVTVV